MTTQPGQQLSIFQVYAAERSMEKEALISTLFKTIAPPEASMEDLVAFVQIARRFDLDPWAGEVFMIKSKGKVKTIIGVDGYTRIVNREPTYDGAEFDYQQDDSGNFIAVTCRMYRKDRTRPTTVTEFYDECIVPSSEAWKKSPSRMLRHRAFVQAARLAFGISGALDEGTAVDYSGPAMDITDASPVPAPAAPKPRRTPPSPGQGDSRGNLRQESPPQTAQASETKAQDQSDDAAFDMDGLLDALANAGSAEELKQIYSDFDPDGNLQDDPAALDVAQTAFVKHSKRLAG